MHADVIRQRPDGAEGGDDRIYFFFTEVSVEYEFVFKLLVPRVARVCKVRPDAISLGSHHQDRPLARAPHSSRSLFNFPRRPSLRRAQCGRSFLLQHLGRGKLRCLAAPQKRLPQIPTTPPGLGKSGFVLPVNPILLGLRCCHCDVNLGRGTIPLCPCSRTLRFYVPLHPCWSFPYLPPD